VSAGWHGATDAAPGRASDTGFAPLLAGVGSTFLGRNYVIDRDAIASGDPPRVPGTRPVAGPRATFSEIFAVGEFRALWTAQALSVAGDQLARVALTLLVYGRTHSPLLAAITFAASVVPTFVGGLVLSGLADVLPRRQVMIACDLSRAVLVAVMALPGVPLGVLVGLLFLVTLISAPFTSARAALYPEILSGDHYVLGTAVTLTTLQFAQAVGFALGGALVGFFGVRTSLVVDAGTFVVSAVIVRLWVHDRPAARGGHRDGLSLSGIAAGVRLVFANPGLRTPMLLGWLVAFYNVPEGVAAPLGRTLGGGAVAVGLILAAGALGASLGAVMFSRLVAPPQRQQWMIPLAAAACAVLILFVFHPALAVALIILTVSGIFDCYQLAANSAFVVHAPPHHRSQAFGVAQGGMSLGQGVAMITAGAAAQHFAPAVVIAVSGALGVIGAVVIKFGLPQLADRRQPPGHPT
jgi:MFS family permease